MALILEFGAGTTKRIDVPQNHAKNNLPIGTILHLNGYSNPDFVIVENQGINEQFPAWGARYACVDLKTKTFASPHDAYTLKYISEKTCNMIQCYITDKVLPADEVLNLRITAEQNRKKAFEAKTAAETEAKRLETLGRELFAKHIPQEAKALIVATYEIDDSDSMTDYFATKDGETVIIGYSMNTRDNFKEMRKASINLEETSIFFNEPTTDENGDAKTETNKTWWHPSDEHREKYSMGAGYYLKATGKYSNGWKVEKVRKWGEGWPSSLFIAMAKRCVF